jgi:copper chaperone CopZ
MRTILNVPDMHCDTCVSRISKAFSKEGIVFTCNLVEKTVQVEGDEKLVNQAIRILDDLSFDATIA